jgi:predicted enzyme related to lactoylglutathione lyase
VESRSILKDRPFPYNQDNPTLLQFEIADAAEMDKAVADLKKQGVKIVREPTETSYGIIANFVDPEGNAYELIVPMSE